jgi:flavin reductase (DIM6/NTAB) family NADH-FMN oxidoreductase RutF
LNLKETNIENLSDNMFKLIGKDWMLIAAGTKEKYNMMTASWAGLGILWGKQVAFIFIRPSRYTYEFAEKHDKISLNFFTEKYRKVLKICGTKSGREMNKMSEVDLTPVKDNDTIYFQEARLVFLCKKLYFQDLVPDNFLTPEIKTHYKNNNFHRMYVLEIEKTLQM